MVMQLLILDVKCSEQGLCEYRGICCFGIVLNFQCRDCVFRIVCVSMDLLFWRTIIPCNDSCGIVNYANVFTFSSGLAVVVVMRNFHHQNQSKDSTSNI